MSGGTPGSPLTGSAGLPVDCSAKLYLVGANRCVDIPADLSAQLGATGRTGVRGTVQGITFRSTLMPRKPNGHRLFVHSRIWRPLGLSPGTTVRVHLELDPGAGDVDIPEWIAEAMDRRRDARATFAALGAATRREIVAWLVRARREETRERRLETALDRLESGRLRSG